MSSIGRRCTFVRWLYREILAVPGSITYLIPGTVSEVSAMLVASTILRPRWEAKMRCCSAVESRANSGTISVAGEIEFIESVGGVPDVAFAGQEHEDVAGTFSHRARSPRR